jgi:basic membrane protein A
VMTSMIKIVDEVIYKTIAEYREGKFKNGVNSLGLKEKGVGFVYDENNKNLILPAYKEKLDDITKKINSGEIKVSAE